MPNRAIHQFPFTSDRINDNDRTYVVRSGADYYLNGSALPQRVDTAVAMIESADVLTMGVTPVLIMVPPVSGVIIVPLRILIQFQGGTTDYDTNTDIIFGSTSTLGDSAYTMAGSIADLTEPNAALAPNSAPLVVSDGISAKVRTGNPANGDSDLVITVFYYEMNP